MTVRPEWHDRIVPAHAGWYAGEQPWDSIYGGPLRLAGNARRFDLSPAWLPWIGTAPALDLLTAVGIEAIHRHNLALADAFCAEMDLPPPGSAIVSMELPSARDGAALQGITAATRAGRLRVCFHLYNTEADVERAVAALRR